MSDPIAWGDLETLAARPPGEWTVFVDDDGEPLPFEQADPVCIARLMGMVESAVGPGGVMGPTYHRITQNGRAELARHLEQKAGISSPQKSDYSQRPEVRGG